jgi:hypothetical protein
MVHERLSSLAERPKLRHGGCEAHRMEIDQQAAVA